jgi:hypothetical protein
MFEILEMRVNGFAKKQEHTNKKWDGYTND